MNICLLGEYSGDLDEGMKKVSSYFAEELSKRHKVLTLDLKNITFDRNFWKVIKSFDPKIIHYIHGPSIKSLMLLKFISIYCRNSKTVVSAMHPRFTRLSEQFIPLFKPDLTLVQSLKSEKIFNKLGYKTEFLPCGVDINKFVPISSMRKEELREKYEIDKKKFVILHIGSIKQGRNVQVFEKLQIDNNQVIIVGAISPGVDKHVLERLEKSGCIVWTKYFENIEEIYAMSDCYIFPVLDRSDVFGWAIADSIEMPLSVLEAISCNLSIIATRFGALPRAFEEGNGLFFFEEEGDLINIINTIKKGVNVKMREQALAYSWDNISIKLEKIYLRIMNNGNDCI